MPSKSRSNTARANGAKSKGPVTPEGKARSSTNAIRHGLNSEVVVLPHEDRAAFEHLRASYMNRFQPADQTEADLIETMASARWRLNRLVAIESKLFEKELALHDEEISKSFDEIDDEGKLACVFDRCANQGQSLSMLMRYESQINRTYDRAFKQLQVLKKPILPAPPKELQNEPKPAPASGRIGRQTGSRAASQPSPQPPPGIHPGDGGTSQPAASLHLNESTVAGRPRVVY